MLMVCGEGGEVHKACSLKYQAKRAMAFLAFQLNATKRHSVNDEPDIPNPELLLTPMPASVMSPFLWNPNKVGLIALLLKPNEYNCAFSLLIRIQISVIPLY